MHYTNASYLLTYLLDRIGCYKITNIHKFLDVCVMCRLFRMTSLSVDYILMILLAVALAVKYIVFDHDDDELQSQDADVAMATVAAAAAGDQLNSAHVTVKSGVVSDGQTQQIDDVTDDSLHSQHTDDITPTGSSLLHGQFFELFCVIFWSYFEN